MSVHRNHSNQGMNETILKLSTFIVVHRGRLLYIIGYLIASVMSSTSVEPLFILKTKFFPDTNALESKSASG